MRYKSKQTILKRGTWNDQEEMFKTQVTAHAVKGVEQGKHSSISGVKKSLYNNLRNQFGSFSENWK